VNIKRLVILLLDQTCWSYLKMYSSPVFSARYWLSAQPRPRAILL